MREHELNKPKVIGIVVRRVITKIGLVGKTGDQHLAVLAHVNREVLPTRLIPSVVHLRLIYDCDGILLVKRTVAVRIVPIQHANPAVYVLVRNIRPEANRFSIFYHDGLIEIKVDLRISASGDAGCRKAVRLKTKSAVSVMDLAILRRCIANLANESRIVAVNVTHVPLINTCFLIKSKENLRTLAQKQLSRC